MFIQRVKVFMKCPRCGSEDLQKKGKRLGNQRYRCKQCSSSFTEGVPYTEAPKHKTLEKKCPKCGHSHVVRDGKLQDGAQRYLCRNCGLRFSDNSTESLSTTWKCPYCGNLLSYSGYGKLGQREYRCKNCGKKCSGDLLTGEPVKRVAFKELNTSVHCPTCGSLNINKAGFKRMRRQSYRCIDCGRQFITDYKVQPKEKGLKEKAIYLILNGHNLRKVSRELGFSERYVREVIQPYYEKESISKEQEDLIIRFGYHCRVPLDYLAPYIKCSERICKAVIKQLKLSPPTSVPS